MPACGEGETWALSGLRGGLLGPTLGSRAPAWNEGLRASPRGGRATHAHGPGTVDTVQARPVSSRRGGAVPSTKKRGPRGCLDLPGTCQPPRNGAPGPRPLLTPAGIRDHGPAGAPRNPKLQSGVDKGHQALQLLLQAPRVPMVLHDPVEALQVVQATLRLRVVHPCAGSKVTSGPGQPWRPAGPRWSCPRPGLPSATAQPHGHRPQRVEGPPETTRDHRRAGRAAPHLPPLGPPGGGASYSPNSGAAGRADRDRSEGGRVYAEAPTPRRLQCQGPKFPGPQGLGRERGLSGVPAATGQVPGLHRRGRLAHHTQTLCASHGTPADAAGRQAGSRTHLAKPTRLERTGKGTSPGSRGTFSPRTPSPTHVPIWGRS